jgi:serine/threonine protein kinase
MLRAVKIVYRDRFHDARPYEREFIGILRVEPLSRANEGLVDILHVGRHEPEGYFYYVMELADDANAGAPLDRRGSISAAAYQSRTLARELKRRGHLAFEECVQLGLNLSSALSHLHKCGLIHRDVKPSNILYVGGTPRLGDIGLVGEAGASASYVGTEGYIPPEGPGTPRADVYSLGKVLYEACTGKDRLEFPTLPATAVEEPGAAHLAELNEVVLKACAHDPHARYQNAEEIHADLAMLHRGQSVRRERRSQRRWRWAGLAGYGLAAGLGLAGGVWWSPLPRLPPPPLPLSSKTNPHGGQSVERQQAVNLEGFYNVALSSNWMHDFPGNHLGSISAEWHRFGPAYFEPKGILQLDGAYLSRLFFPDAVKKISIARKCERLWFLHGTAWQAENGRHVGSYVVNYADGRKEEIILRYGEDFRDWWWKPQDPLEVTRATLAWVGTNAATGLNAKLCLFCLAWNNPFPDIEISTLDFISTRSSSCPFLIAVTAE